MSTAQYQVSSFIAPVYSEPSTSSTFLGIVWRGSKIIVTSTSSGWANFIYNNTSVYIRTSYLRLIQILGSVKINYIDSITEESISNSQEIENLTLGSYTYNALTIPGYTVSGIISQTVTLTQSIPDQSITFKYNKITGSVLIKYVDSATLTNIAPNQLYTNLNLTTYTYSAPKATNYKVNGDLSQSVTLTQDTPNQTITFRYDKILGSVTVKYIDAATSLDVSPSNTFTDLTLGTYSYNAATVSGYSLNGASTETVTLTESAQNQTVVFKYNKLLGSITVKYVNATTLAEISPSKLYSNLDIGSYTHTAINVSGYNITGSNTQTVIITENNLNQTITFKYEKILGSITIKYIDTESNSEIAPLESYTNLDLTSYSYNAKIIDDYTNYGDFTKTVLLTEAAPNQTIVFTYTMTMLALDISEQNYVPYISTYYITPVVKPGDEVKIDYYITDYYHKEYLEEDYSYRFKVTLRVEGRDDVIQTNLKAGDHSISLGYFDTEGEKKFSILCTDMYGRNSHELFNFFLVRNEAVINEYVMTEADLIPYNIKNTDDYEQKVYVKVDKLTDTTVGTNIETVANATIVPSKKYICFIGTTETDDNCNPIMQTTPAKFWLNTIVKYADDYDKDAVLQEATNTRIGLQKFLDDKKADGFNKVKLLPGIYRIDHQKQIYIPSEFTLNLNESTIKLNQFQGENTLMIDLNNTFDSHIINGFIEGDYYSHIYDGFDEQNHGIRISSGSRYSSVENLVIKNIVGYGGINGIAKSRDESFGYTYLSPKSIGNSFVLGDIDSSTGLDIPSINRTTCPLIDITGYSYIGYLSISVYLGYQRNPCGTWNLICHFYDSSKNHIKSIDSFQYRRVGVPTNAKYIRVTILNISYPTTLSIQYFRVPTHCAFNTIKFDNCRCVGMAPQAMKDLLFTTCNFSNCGQSSAKCALDAEDGWDMMQDVTYSNLNFNNNPTNDFLTCAGHNFIIDNQGSGKIAIWERTRSLIIKNCKNVNVGLQSGGLSTIVKHGVYRIYNNTFTGGTVANNLSRNNICTGGLGGLVYNSTLGTIVDGSNYNNCIINISSTFLNYIKTLTMVNCVFKPIPTFTERYKLSFNGGHLNSYYFKDCIFHGKSSFSNHNYFFSGNFTNCTFDDVNIYPNVISNPDDIILFNNCTIGYSGSNLIYYSPFAYTVGTFTNVQFNNCSIKNIDNNNKSLVYAYAAPNGSCNFTNCNFTIPQSLTIFDGIALSSNITSYTINFINSPLPSTAKLISTGYSSNPGIKINIS